MANQKQDSKDSSKQSTSKDSGTGGSSRESGKGSSGSFKDDPQRASEAGKKGGEASPSSKRS